MSTIRNPQGSSNPKPLFGIFALCVIMTFLTELTSNTAATTMMMPILCATAVAVGENPLLFMIPTTLSASCAFMLPVATPPNAIVFGSGWISIRQMARAGLIINLAGIIIIFLVTIVWIKFFQNIEYGVLPEWVK